MATRTKAEPEARSAEQIAQSIAEALKAHDLDALMANWSEDGVEDVVPMGILRGREEIRENLRTMFAATPDLEVTLEKIVADDDRAVIQWRGSGTFDGEPFNGIEPNGRHIALRFVDLLEIEDGAIVRNTVYYDSAAFARQVGMMPEQESGAEKAMIAAFNAVTKVRKAIDRRQSTA